MNDSSLLIDQTDWVDDEEDQLQMNDLDEEVDVEEIQERKIQWQRAQRYIRAKSDPHLGLNIFRGSLSDFKVHSFIE